MFVYTDWGSRASKANWQLSNKQPKRESLFSTHRLRIISLFSYSLLAGRPPFEGKCDSKCGWDDGEPCDECQESLFNAIQSGKLEFPDNIFRSISREVIDLVSHYFKCLCAIFNIFKRFPDYCQNVRKWDQHRRKYWVTLGSRKMI